MITEEDREHARQIAASAPPADPELITRLRHLLARPTERRAA